MALRLVALLEDGHREPCPGLSGAMLFGMDSTPGAKLSARGVSATVVDTCQIVAFLLSDASH